MNKNNIVTMYVPTEDHGNYVELKKLVAKGRTSLWKYIKKVTLMNHYARVKAFMSFGGQRVRETVDRDAPMNLRILGVKLILEEAVEVCAELGIEVKFDTIIKDVGVVNVGRLAKELADLHVVTTWNMIAYGIPETVQDTVDLNNLDKFGPGWTKNEYGKVIPPPNFVKLRELVI